MKGKNQPTCFYKSDKLQQDSNIRVYNKRKHLEDDNWLHGTFDSFHFHILSILLGLGAKLQPFQSKLLIPPKSN